jgi:GntR family transcriptional regulator
MPIPWLPAADHSGRVSVSKQIAEHLRAAMREGAVKQGGQLPTQHQLMGHYRVSRETVRRALDMLTMEGLIESVQRVGTFATIRAKGPVCARCGDIIDKGQES